MKQAVLVKSSPSMSGPARLPFECHLCPEEFLVESSLKKHLHTHSPSQQDDLHFLDRSTSVDDSNQASRPHATERPYKCKFCIWAFAHPYQLARHTRVHTGEKPFKCSHCQRSFSLKGNRDVHMQQHVGNKDSQCKQCHKVLHAGETLYRCEHCPRAYTNLCSLQRHLQTHSVEKPF